MLTNRLHPSGIHPDGGSDRFQSGKADGILFGTLIILYIAEFLMLSKTNQLFYIRIRYFLHITVLTPTGGSLKDYAFREAAYVFYRNGLYYFMWSVDDTGSPNYHVAYGTSKSPLGPMKVAKKPVVLIQDPAKEIYGPAHNAVLQIPGTDEWYIVYHRINKNFIDREKGPGVHREVCIDRMEFNPDCWG